MNTHSQFLHLQPGYFQRDFLTFHIYSEISGRFLPVMQLWAVTEWLRDNEKENPRLRQATDSPFFHIDASNLICSTIVYKQCYNSKLSLHFSAVTAACATLQYSSSTIAVIKAISGIPDRLLFIGVYCYTAGQRQSSVKKSYKQGLSLISSMQKLVGPTQADLSARFPGLYLLRINVFT